MKLNTKELVKDLAGTPLLKDDKTNLTYGEALSNVILSSKEGGRMKLYTLAQKMFTESVVELDDADLILVKNCVKRAEIYGVLVLGQIEIYLENLSK